MDIEAVERRIEQFIEDIDSKDIKDLVSKIPSGKRLRARLILEIAGVNTLSIKLAAIVEMIHAASLLHDDVIDNAYQRRGKASINAIFGNKSAIMLGDILYSKAFFELVDIDRRVAKLISNSVLLLSIGEREDILLSNEFNISKERYLEMIYKKTASLIEASAASAALLANKDYKIYAKYGKNLGIAFQMIDDILDIISDEKKLGKPAMHDLKEGKMTLPYIYLYKELNEDDKNRLKSLFKKDLTSKDRNWILNNMNKFGAIKKAKEEAKGLVLEAIALMEKANEPNLRDIALKMVDRDF